MFFPQKFSFIVCFHLYKVVTIQCLPVKYDYFGTIRERHNNYEVYFVVVYHVTIVAIGHGLLKKFWPLVISCVLRTAGSSIIILYVENI